MNKNLSQSELWSIDAEKWRKQEEGMKPLYDEVIRSIELPNDSMVLDVGCGTGYFLSLLQEKSFQLHGMDISSSQIDFAKKQLPEGKFQIGDMEKLPFDDQTFDLFCSNNSLQFSNNVEKALSEMNRVLRPGKQLIISLWDEAHACDAYSYFKVFYRLTNQSLENSIPFNLSSKNQLEVLLKAAGFEVESTNSVAVSRVYQDLDQALQAILSSGPANYAIQNSSYDLVKTQVTEAIQNYLMEDGTYIFKNHFVYRMASKID